MKCRIIGSIVVAMMLSTISPRAQTNPSFAGKWILVPDTTKPGGNGGCPPSARWLGQEFAATQTPTVLTIEQEFLRADATLKYKLDGSESKNEISGGQAVSKASWNGKKLTISTTSVFATGGGDVPTVTMKSTHDLALEPTGLLSVTMMVSCRDHPPETITVAYRRAS